MEDGMPQASEERSVTASVGRVGFWAALFTSLIGAVSLGVAVTTPPRSGPFAAPGEAITFPYAEAAQFVPRDFLWMYPALLMMLAFLVLAVCLQARSTGERRIFGTVALVLASIAVAVILVDYFVQLQTVQPALLRGEGESIAAISQYNPHGLFITLENLGFLLLSIALGFFAFTLGRSRLERVVRWLFVGCASLSVIAFVGMWGYFGFDLEYLFEVAVISLVWLTLIVSGALLSLVFKRGAPGACA